MHKWPLAVALAAFLFLLGGCGWLFSPGPPRELPRQLLSGWEKETEAAIYAGDLPAGASGALAGVWRKGDAWLWVQVLAFPDSEIGHARFLQEISSLDDAQGAALGDEGVELFHPPSGLALELFRVGGKLVLVGSLAATPEDAPPAEEVRRAAQALIGRLPEIPPAEEGLPPGEACHPPDETAYLKVFQVSLSLDGADNGALTLVLEVVPLGEEAGLCRYRFDLYLKCIELGPEDGDPGLRGPGDLFLAGSLALPCGDLKFLTGEVAQVAAEEGLEFPGKGLSIASRDCLAPCGLQNVPINLNLLLRNHNRVNLIDLMAAFFWALARAQPQAQPLWETAEGLSRTYGPEGREPDDPEAAAEAVPGTPLGEGTAQISVDLPGGYLSFEMTVAVHGECQQVSEDTVRCRAMAGEEGRAQLTARTEPPNYQVTIQAVDLTPWASFQPVAGYGLAQTECTFLPPLEAVGGTFELVFRATAGELGVARDLRLILEVVAPEEVG